MASQKLQLHQSQAYIRSVMAHDALLRSSRSGERLIAYTFGMCAVATAESHFMLRRYIVICRWKIEGIGCGYHRRTSYFSPSGSTIITVASKLWSDTRLRIL